MKPRNPFAIVVKKRKAGSHRKSTKALRKLTKQSRHDETGYHSGLLSHLSEFKSQCLDQVYIKTH